MNPSLPLRAFLAAVESNPAPAGRSSAAGVAIILICLAAAVAVAARAALKHLKGAGGCCGGTSAPPPPDEKKIGPVVATRTMELAGMHCMNCVGRVKRALDAIDGVSADVSLDPQRAVVKEDRPVSDDELRKAVEDQGFEVRGVS